MQIRLFESDSEERTLVRVSKDGPPPILRDGADAPPQDEGGAEGTAIS